MSDSDERGAAAVLALVLLGALTSVLVVGLVLAGLVVGQRRAAAAADLAALAGASAIQHGHAGCVAARHVAVANRTRLTSCQEQGGTVLVTVEAAVGALLGSQMRVPGRARAGPVG